MYSLALVATPSKLRLRVARSDEELYQARVNLSHRISTSNSLWVRSFFFPIPPFQTMFELSNKLLTQGVVQCLHRHHVTEGITPKYLQRRTIVNMPPPEVSSIVTSLSTQAAQNV